MPADTVAVSLGAWTGGLNWDADPFKAQANELTDGINFDVDSRGTIRRRKGTKVVASFGSDGFVRHRIWNGKHVVVTSSGNVLAGNVGGSLVSSGRKCKSATMASLDGRLFLTSIDGERLRYDGSTWHAYSPSAKVFVPADTLDKAIDEGSSLSFARQLPYAKVLLAAHNRLFAFNVKDSDNRHRRYRVYFSGYEADPAFDPQIWPAHQWFDVGRGDGQGITGAVYLGSNTIAIFKEHSLWLLVGRDAASFYLEQVDSHIGTVAPGTAAASEGRLFFFDPYNGVKMWDGAVMASIDEKIHHTLMEGINRAQIHRAVGVIHKNRYWLSVPWGSANWPNRTFIYDFHTGAWSVYSYGVGSFYSHEGELYGAAGSSANVLQLDTGTSADEWFVETAFLVPEELGGEMRLRRLDLALGATGDYTLKVDLYPSFATAPSHSYNIQVGSGGLTWGRAGAQWGTGVWGQPRTQAHVKKAGWGGYEHSYRLRLSTNTPDVPVELNQITFQLSSRPRRRGER